ncbi:MAG: hypothetical protein BZY75_01920 [SAR202 cluster bacterium Io17-Chloro-G7]|nr:MAG: hypothetical protein BZY75_01920 [SAR202 cluster bacterium Io17-Chloro-G7]
MGNSIAASLVLTVFLLITSVVFLILISTYTDRTVDAGLLSGQQLLRVKSGVSLNSTSQSNPNTCNAYTAQVENTGEITVEDFADVDVLVEYPDSVGDKVVARLGYNSDWSVTGIAPDTRDPNVWNPGETVTISVSLPTGMQSNGRGVVLVSSPLAVADSRYFTCFCSASGNTGFTNPSVEVADTGGNGDGFEIDPIGAFADGGTDASNINGAGDRHRFYDYGFSTLSACNISGIEVRLDWWLDATGGNNSMAVELSWDGGISWTAAKTDTEETTTEHTVVLGGSDDTWGHTWSSGEFTNANFRVRVVMEGVGGRNHFLDWVPVKVYYSP